MKGRKAFGLALSVVVACLARASPEASAASVVYGFTNLTNNSAVNAATAGQYRLTVSDEGMPLNQVSFLFENVGPADSSIAQAYVHGPNGPLATLITINSGPGVDFVAGGSPPSLPGGGPFGFPTGQPGTTFRATAGPPPASNGIHPNEWLQLVFTLQSGQDFNDVISALNLGMGNPNASGAMLVGIHVIGFAGGGSESFALVPLPAAAWMGLAGLGLIACGRGYAIRRRRDFT